MALLQGQQALLEMVALILDDNPTERCLRRGGDGRLPQSFQEALDGLEPGPLWEDYEVGARLDALSLSLASQPLEVIAPAEPAEARL